MKNILHLNLKKKWFDMILFGEKKEEYREITDYWVRRLCFKKAAERYAIRHFDSIVFSNGYAKNRPQFEIELKNIVVAGGKAEWGAENGKNYFVLKLGEIITNNNSHQADYLDSKIKTAKNTWEYIDIDEYIRGVRGE